MKKNLVIFVVVAVLAVGIYAVWKLGLVKKPSGGGSSVPTGGLPAIQVPSNPLEKVPEVNPVDKTNPFKDVKTNPFD